MKGRVVLQEIKVIETTHFALLSVAARGHGILADTGKQGAGQLISECGVHDLDHGNPVLGFIGCDQLNLEQSYSAQLVKSLHKDRKQMADAPTQIHFPDMVPGVDRMMGRSDPRTLKGLLEVA